MSKHTTVCIWSPHSTVLQEWAPSAGWNASFSPAERVQCAAWYLHLLDTMQAEQAEQAAVCRIFQAKYTYSLGSSINPSMVTKKNSV